MNKLRFTPAQVAVLVVEVALCVGAWLVAGLLWWPTILTGLR